MSDVAERALTLLERHLDALSPGWADDAGLADIARTLSKGFTEDRRARDTPTLDARGRAAYLAYFAPRTIAALAHVCARTTPIAPVVVDVGAGTGASSLFAALAGAKTLHLVDKDARAVERARALVTSSTGAHVVTRTDGRIADAHDGDMLLSFSLSEIAQGDDEARAAAIDRVLDRAFDRLILVDGGDRTASRNLGELRARALARGLSIAFPCPHDDVCPALARATDWCHLKTTRALTERFFRFARAVGRDAEHMSFSALVVERRPMERARDREGVLVLGDPQVEKGRARIAVCGPAGLRTLQALRRHAPVADGLVTLSPGVRAVVHGEQKGAVLHLDAPPVVTDDGGAR